MVAVVSEVHVEADTTQVGMSQGQKGSLLLRHSNLSGYTFSLQLTVHRPLATGHYPFK